MENHLSVVLRSEPHEARGVIVQKTLPIAHFWHCEAVSLVLRMTVSFGSWFAQKEIPPIDSRLRALSHLQKRFQMATIPHEFAPGKFLIAILVCLPQEPLEERPEMAGYF